MGVWGPLPQGTMGLLLGKSSLSLRGITVISEVIDCDYQGEIQVFMTCKGLHIFPPQTRIAQLLLLPYWVPRASQNPQGTQGIRRTEPKGPYWAQTITS